MNLRQLQYLATVAQARSLTAAASELKLSQPALGMQIRSLEEEFGVALLLRHSRGVELTEAGRLLMDHAEQIFAQVERAGRALKELDANPQGPAAIGLTPTVGRLLGPAIVAECQARYPAVALSLTEGLSEELMQHVLRGRLDFCFSYNPPASEGLACQALFNEELCFTGAAGSPLDATREIAFAEVAAAALILPSRPHGLRVLMERAAAVERLSLAVTVEVDSNAMKRDIVMAGLGYTVVPFGNVADEVTAGRMFARRIVSPVLARTLYLASPRHVLPSKAATHLRSMVIALVEDRLAAGAPHGWST